MSIHALFGLLRSFRYLFPCLLVVSCAHYLFLASFIYIRKFINAYLLSVFSMLIFPNSFFPYPRAYFEVLNFSAYFPAFRQLLYVLVYFDRFAFIWFLLWVLICFSESEPLGFSSLTKIHKVVKLKRRPQWWPNVFLKNINWREALKHMHYLLAIIESSSFVCSLVASLVVSHHWRWQFHLITYCSSASSCKAVRSSWFYLHCRDISWSWKGFKFPSGFLAMKTCHPIVVAVAVRWCCAPQC